MSSRDFVVAAAYVAVFAPAVAGILLFARAGLGVEKRERFVNAVALLGARVAALAGLAAAAAYVARGASPIDVAMTSWFSAGEYEFSLGVGIDGRALTLLALSGVVSLMVVQMSVRYLHREVGHRRFFALLALGQLGIALIALADGLDLLYVGWELVGIASALLIGFYSERRTASRHGLLAFAIYRTCDIGLLGAIVLLHHVSGRGGLPDAGAPPELAPPHAALLGALLLFGAMGKSAQFPLTGYLPRAMEGPSPSSAVFYGGLSVHAGAFLLLRTAPLFERVAAVRYAIVAVGAATALHSTLVGRAQTDAKSQLAYATTQQVGLVFVEIGLGLESLALLHLTGNALLRSAQLLRASSLLEDHVRLEADLGVPRQRPGVPVVRHLPPRVEQALYHYALERGHVDTLAARALAGIERLLAALSAADRRLLERSALGLAPPAPEERPTAAEDKELSS